ncbi:unnamed protein product [Eruca vesicaria subsp. sativa]|uniref:Uncharacterized protein n=1 Tax=Eruca vesicaria subsp. sativa TaxID=29727 RepID=A0ABC8L2V3_ERUVS|nr:unnamed protein product [Eruca vesicaria subsp. sativa]
MPSQEGLSALYNKKEGISSDDDDGLMNSCEELRLGNILKAQKEIGVNSSDLASSLQTRLDITLGGFAYLYERGN